MNAKFHVSGDEILDMAPDFSEIPLPDEKDAPPESYQSFTPSELAELEREEANVTIVEPDKGFTPPKANSKPTVSVPTKAKSFTISPVTKNAENPDWWDGKRINEVMLAAEFVEENSLCYAKGQFFSKGGKLEGDDVIRTAIYETIKHTVTSGLSGRIGNILETVRRECSSKALEFDPGIIHVANGTLSLDGSFSPEMKVCRHRLPVVYDPNAPEPKHFMSFLSQLFFPEDIQTVKEFVGYCLLPITHGQKMLLIIGRGGEGKSTFGGVLSALFGSASTNSSIHALEASRFNIAELEDKLLMIDDDMKLDALPSTNKLKTLVTAIDPVQVERKGIQPYLARLYCRVIGFGNYSLESFTDSSAGFFRRQIILKTRVPERGRKPDPNLLGLLKCELSGILNWALEGLQSLAMRNYQFTISKRALNNLTEVMLEANNIPDFLGSGFVIPNAISTIELYSGYQSWCDQNGEETMNRKRFMRFLKENCERYGLRYSKNIRVCAGSYVRGFEKLNSGGGGVPPRAESGFAC